MSLLLEDEPVAVDFEFQQYLRAGGFKQAHRLGWIAVINTKGETIFECFVRYDKEDGTRVIMPPKRFGVTHAPLQLNNGAIPAGYAETWLAQILEERTVIWHGGTGGDSTACKIVDPFKKAKAIVDTQGIYGCINLADLMAQIFPNAAAVQVDGRHTPVEDAQSTMKLYLHAHPYDRIAEKAKLEKQGLDPICKTPVQQARQVLEMRGRHAHAARMYQSNAGNGRGGRGGGRGGGGGGGRGRGRGA